jgi:hypothetical protein
MIYQLHYTCFSLLPVNQILRIFACKIHKTNEKRIKIQLVFLYLVFSVCFVGNIRQNFHNWQFGLK